MPVALVGLTMIGTEEIQAQQFNSDSYWVAPEGVVTWTASVGQEFNTAIATVALIEGWEFNLGGNHFPDIAQDQTEDHWSAILYAKYRFFENTAGNGGFAVMGGTGVNPGHLELGQVTDSFKSWWATGAYTLPFFQGNVSLDLMPGFIWNTDQDLQGENAWGFTWSTRVAVYKVIPKMAIVGEVFGTEGEAGSEPQYKVGLRWESPKLVVAATYGRAFNGSGGARFELGFSYFTEPFFKLFK